MFNRDQLIKLYNATPSSVLRELKKELSEAKIGTYEWKIFRLVDQVLRERDGIVVARTL